MWPLCPNWKEKPNGSCARYDKTGDTIMNADLDFTGPCPLVALYGETAR